MKNDIRENRQTLKELFDKVIATNNQGIALPLDGAFEDTIEMIIHQAKAGGKLFFIGNGASASIASHMATDFWKNGGIPALAFNDSSLLTCVSNDYGYQHVFEKPLEMFAAPQDILFAISSSGQSENIVRAASMAKARGLKVITLSGFDEGNPLRKLGDMNFYVPISEYGHVEVVHSYICHCLVDVIIKNRFRERIECNE
jgi:D-sedoheptulose 7-phosphate isomerase